MNQTETQKQTGLLYQFLGRSFKPKGHPANETERIELANLRRSADNSTSVMFNRDYTRFGVLESLREKGYVYRTKEDKDFIHYKLTKEYLNHV